MRKIDFDGVMDEIRALRRELRRERRKVRGHAKWWEYLLLGGAILVAIAGGLMIVWLTGTLP